MTGRRLVVGGVSIEYLDDEPNGLASMIGGLIEANLARHPERSALLSHPAIYAIEAPDVDVGVSIRITPQRVQIRNGVVRRTNVLIRGNSDALVGMSAVPLRFGLPDLRAKEGREVIRKLLSRALRVRGMVLHAAKLARLNKLLSV